MNSIPKKQNEALSIKRLAAQRAVYSRAKTFFGLQLLLNIPVVILIAIVVLALDKEWFGLPKYDIAWVVGATGILFLMMDTLFWNTKINTYREKAARIQQAFDCEVLVLPVDEITYGKAPDKEEVENWSDAFPSAQLGDLHDWYRPEVGSLPLESARLICQRSNCWWDMDLRRRYNKVVFVVATIFLLSISIIAIALDCTTKTIFGQILAPSLPFLTIAIKLIKDNNDAIDRLQAMKETLDSLWETVLKKGISDADLRESSIRIQAGIFLNRKNNPLIFDWIHQRIRPKHESTTSKSTIEYVTEYLASRQP
jgi:hypothetical protein